MARCGALEMGLGGVSGLEWGRQVLGSFVGAALMGVAVMRAMVVPFLQGRCACCGIVRGLVLVSMCCSCEGCKKHVSNSMSAEVCSLKFKADVVVL